MIRKGYAALLAMFALILGLVALLWAYYLGADMLPQITQESERFGHSSHGFDPLAPASSIPPDKAFTKPVQVKNGAKDTGTMATVTVTAYKLQPSKGKLVGDLLLKVPVSLKEKIRPRLSDTVDCIEGTSGQSRVPGFKEQYQGLQGQELVISLQSETDPSSAKIPIPLEDFLASSIRSASDTCEEQIDDITNRSNTLRLPMEIPILIGSIQEYPSDSQQLSANVRIILPTGLVLTEDGRKGAPKAEAIRPTLPHGIQVRSTRGTEGRTIYVLGPEARLPSPRSIDERRIAALNADALESPIRREIEATLADDADLRLLIVRDWRTQLFVYIVTLLPLALFLILMAILSSDRTSDFSDTTISFAIAMLSVLPLRAVLVPADVQGLTRVDYALGIQLILIVVAALLLTSWHLWRSSPERDERGR